MTEPASPVGPGVTLANWRTAQFLQWSLQHAREFLPTARVARAGAIAELPGTPGSVAGVSLSDANGAATTVGAVIASTYTDGFLVMHHGRVVMEEYLADMTADTVHAVMSVTKSMVGCVAAVLIGRGMLDPAAPLTAYVPELAGSGYAGATVRHVLDMRSGIIFSEDYLDPRSEIRQLEQCVGWSPPAEPGLAASIYDFLLTLRQGSAHGGPFAYRSCEADVLGWVCERAADARMPELMSGLLWGRLGAEHDADLSLDRAGLAVHDGGLSAALRDLARFGQMLADGGRSMTGQQVLPRMVGTGHAGRRSGLTCGLRRQPDRCPHARRDVPELVLGALPGVSCRAEPGDPRPDGVRQHRRQHGRREAVELARAPGSGDALGHTARIRRHHRTPGRIR